MKILKVKCPDQVGIISKVSTVLFKNNINIIKLDEYVEPSENYFFCRAEVDGDDSQIDLQKLICKELTGDADVRLISPQKKNIVIMATKESHCLGDLLLRSHSNSLNINIQSVIANYDSLRELSTKFNIPYHFISHEDLSRQEHAEKIKEQIEEYSPDYIVLA